MFRELDPVVLAHDLTAHGLREGDIGTVVHRYSQGEAYEVEFVTGLGATVAVISLRAEELRSLGGKEILHVRALAAAA